MPSSVSRSISSSGAFLTVAALVPSGYVIGTSTAVVLTSLIVSCGRRAALPGAISQIAVALIFKWSGSKTFKISVAFYLMPTCQQTYIVTRGIHNYTLV